MQFSPRQQLINWELKFLSLSGMNGKVRLILKYPTFRSSQLEAGSGDSEISMVRIVDDTKNGSELACATLFGLWIVNLL